MQLIQATDRFPIPGKEQLTAYSLQQVEETHYNHFRYLRSMELIHYRLKSNSLKYDNKIFQFGSRIITRDCPCRVVLPCFVGVEVQRVRS